MKENEKPVDTSKVQQGSVPTQKVAVISGSNYENVIKTILAAGGKRVNGLRIKNVNYTEKDNYTMISLTLCNSIRGFVSDDNGVTFKEGNTNTLFTSLYAIVGTLKEDEELGWMGNALLENPQALNLVLNGASVDVIQQDVAAGTEYKNPFSTQENVEGVVYDHDIIINNVIKFKLGKTGLRMSDKLADKLMGF